MSTTLERLGEPYFFEVDTEALNLGVPTPRLDVSQRTRVRAVDGMQKEALVTSSESGKTWRLVSDEGEYLDGADVAPAPLAFMTTGMVSSFATELLALADDRGVDLRDLTLVQDNYYTMNGSAFRGTMEGGALPVDLTVRADADVDDDELRSLVERAVEMAPIHGLMTEARHSRFKLALGGVELTPDGVTELDGSMLADPGPTFERLSYDADRRDPPLLHRTGRTTEPLPEADQKYTSGEGSSLEAEQDRLLHVRGVCTLRDDGLKHVEVKLFSPIGTVFELLSEEPAGRGGRGRAPDAGTYVAAGLGFCFMTQFGRYADIVRKELSEYRIVQDTHFSAGGATGGTGDPGRAEPVETHVFLDSPEGEGFAREVLDMSEQTCFLHAFCRTDLDGPSVTVERTGGG
jgi:uncharacterized OsmC-like protein